MIPRRLPLLFLFLLAPLSARAEIKVEASTFNSLEGAAHLLARGGRAEESRELVAILGALGYSKDSAQKLAGALEKEIAAAKSKAKELPEAQAKLESAAGELAALLPALKAEELERVARAIVRLDDTNEAAHRALGDEQTPEGWKRPEERALLPRRSRILDVLRSAHDEELDIQTEASTHELLVAMHGGPGSVARFRGISVHAPWSPERTARVLGEALRACAVCAFLLDDDRGVPDEGWFVRPRSVWVLTDARKEYDAGLAKALENGWVDKEVAEQAKTLWGFQDKRGNSASYAPSDAENAAAIFCWLAPLEDGSTSALKAGLYSYVCQAYLGTQLPGFTWKADPHDWRETYVKPSADEQKELDKRLQVAKAGLPGARSWMNWLVRRHEDPPFSRCMVDFFGKLSGEDLLKCTSMVEYWQERGALRPILTSVAIVPVNKALETYAKALGETPTSLESKWRGWVVSEEPSLCARIGKKSSSAAAAGTPEEELRSLLAALRTKCIPAAIKSLPVEIDAALGLGCRAHAEYLTQNPEQAKRWPEAHTELPDKPGYSASGAWAAAHSLVTPIKPSVREALDAWMGTYFHRLPLIDPGLLRVGWGANKDFQVLDAYSLRRPPDASWAVVWPHEEMQKVPLRATDELPSPVPQADPASLGYPITLQVGLPEAGDPPLAVVMRLWEGNAEVECWFSSPDKPLNPRVVPQRAFALIPKQPLKPGVRYQVTAEWTGTPRKKSWFFRT